MFDQAGVIATRSLGELVDAAALLACQPLPAGDRVAIVANAGGAGALAADACADHGLQVVRSARPPGAAARLLPATAVVPGRWTPARCTTETFRACLEDVAADGGVDAVLAVAVPTAFSDLRPRAEAVISKPLAVALLDRAESVRRLSAGPSHSHRPARTRTPARRAVHRPRPGGGSSTRRRRPSPACPVTPTPISGPRAGSRGPLPGLARAAARQGPRAARAARGRRARPGHRFPGRPPAGGWLPQARQPSCCPATASRWWPP